MNVSTISLGAVADVSAGQPAPKANEFADEGHPFIRAGSLEGLLNGGSENSLEKVPESTASRKRLKLFPEDTVLFAKSGMSAKLGRVYRLKSPAYVVSHLAAVKPTGRYDPNYLTYWLRANPPSRLIKDDAYPSIRTSEIAEMEVPALDVNEQHRIAAILDKAESIRSKREQAISMTGELLRAAFLEMFGDPVLNTKQLPTAALGDIIKVSSGNGLTAKKMDPNGRYPVYGGNGVNGYHSEYMFEDPQIVIGRVGVYCGAVHVSQPKAWITDNALYVREYKRQINRTYLEWALRFANLNQYAGRAAQPLISGSRIYPIEIVVPSDNMQDSFAAFVERQKKFEAKLQAAHSDAKALFGSLSQRAFRGEL